MRFFSIALGVVWLLGCSSTPPPLPEEIGQPLTVTPMASSLAAEADLPDLLAYAGEHHPALARARAEYQQARAAYQDSGTLADPQLGLSLGLNDADWQTLSLSQEVPTFSRRALNQAQARAVYQAARKALQQAQLEVQSSVLEAYGEYAYVQASRQVLAQQQALLEQLQDVAEQRYATGQAPLNELLRSQNEYDQTRTELLNLDALHQASAARLNAALGRSADATLPAPEPLDKVVTAYQELPGDHEELTTALTTRNPALLAAEHRLESLGREQQLAEREGLPRLSLGVEYMEMPMSSGTLAGMASVSLPIWRSGYAARQEAAAAGVTAGQAELRQLEQELSADLQMVLYRWSEVQRHSELYGTTLRTRSGQAVSSALTAYQTGQGDFSGLLESQREWLTFSLTYYQALADQLSLYGQLLQLTGTNLLFSSAQQTQPDMGGHHDD